MLTYYAYQLKFDTVEINYTYYRQPSARTLSAIAGKYPRVLSLLSRIKRRVNKLLNHPEKIVLGKKYQVRARCPSHLSLC